MKRFSYRAATAIGLSLACASAMAADPLPDSLSLGGVTVYGTVDVGYAYQSHGVPLNSQLPGGLEYQAFTTTRNYAGSVSSLAESGLEQSKIGIRVAEPIAGDFTLIATADDSGATAQLTTVKPPVYPFVAGEKINIGGVSVAGYNGIGIYAISKVVSPTIFQYKKPRKVKQHTEEVLLRRRMC